MKKTTRKGDQPFYRRNLPHWQPENSVLFITARLDGSLPKQKIKELMERMEAERTLLKSKNLSKADLDKALSKNYNLYFGKFDKLLDGNTEGPHWLKEEKIATIWNDALKHFDGERYQLICSTIMSNHVHFIFFKLKESLAKIMHSLKSYTGTQSNKVLDRVGHKFWQYESFDRMVRDKDELIYRINYVLKNPVEAGLVKHWGAWKYNYVHPEFLKMLNRSSSTLLEL